MAEMKNILHGSVGLGVHVYYLLWIDWTCFCSSSLFQCSSADLSAEANVIAKEYKLFKAYTEVWGGIR